MNPGETCEIDSSSKKYTHDLEKENIDIGGSRSYENNLKACIDKKDDFCNAINNTGYEQEEMY